MILPGTRLRLTPLAPNTLGRAKAPRQGAQMQSLVSSLALPIPCHAFQWGLEKSVRLLTGVSTLQAVQPRQSAIYCPDDCDAGLVYLQLPPEMKATDS